MNTTRFSLLVCFALCASFLNSADANHRTGTLALPEEMVTGDFNGDGNLDLAVNVTGFDNIGIFLGDGAGGLNLIGHIATNTLPKGLAIADMNRDGHSDFIEANAWGYTGVVYSGDGKGAFRCASLRALLLHHLGNSDPGEKLEMLLFAKEEGVIGRDRID